MKKGINPLVGIALVTAIAFVGIGIVLNAGNIIVQTGTTASQVDDAKQTLATIDKAIQEVSREGQGATRIIEIVGPGKTQVIDSQDAVEFEIPSGGSELFDYNARSRDGNILFITGSGVRCAEQDGNSDGTADLVLENELIKVVFTNVERASPLANFDTNSTILLMNQKTKNINLTITNASIIIDDDLETTQGTGYSEIIQPGSGLALCTVHVYVNTSIEYDAYYTLYSGADFIEAEIRNVR